MPSRCVALLSKASADNGQDTFKRCLQCHTPEKGGPNRVGPNLWGVVGRKAAQHAGFPYSEAMKNHSAELDLAGARQPICTIRKGAIPGNKMAFAGVKDNAELADLLAYCASCRTARRRCRSRCLGRLHARNLPIRSGRVFRCRL